MAKIPAYSSEVMQVRTMSDDVPYAYRAILLKSESKEEILADKIIALGARPYIKQRDLWDIHMLAQAGVSLQIELVRWKIKDYFLDRTNFVQSLHSRIKQLGDQATIGAFQKEMSRFLEGPHRAIIQNASVVHQMLSVVAGVAEGARNELALDGPIPPEAP